MTEKSPWVRLHIERDSIDTRHILFLEGLEPTIEAMVGRIAHDYQRENQCDTDTARREAVMLVVQAALIVQRRLAPASLAAMVVGHFFDDPLLEDERARVFGSIITKLEARQRERSLWHRIFGGA